MASSSNVDIPPRPRWFSPRNTAPAIAVEPNDTLPDDVRQRRLLRGLGNVSSGVMVSACLHIVILLILNIWFFVMRPGASGYVIDCVILTEDDGAESPVNQMVQTAMPDEPPPGGDIRLDLPVGGHGGGKQPPRPGGGGGQGDGNGAGGGGVGFFGTKAEGKSFVFVVDRSGSMQHQERLTAAKRELNRAIATLKPHQQFYVFFYNDQSHRMLGPGGAPAGLVFATPEMKDQVRTWMRALQPKGGTEPAESLLDALKMRPDVLFFLTDGEFPEETVPIVTGANHHGTRIHTTALVSKSGETMMQQIARQNHGRYLYISTVPQSADEAGRQMARTDLNQRAAEAKLRLARKHINEGRPRTGRRWLEEVLTEYPGTTQAQQARQLLTAL